MGIKQFITTDKEGAGFAFAARVLVDTETGVQYLFVHDGYAGGLTVLLDKDGKPPVDQAGPGIMAVPGANTMVHSFPMARLSAC